MKKIIGVICGLFLSTLFFVSCSKKGNEPEGPNVTVITSGHLCTRGPSALAGLDTLNFWFPSTGSTLTGYRSEWARPVDKVSFTNTSEGKVRIELITPYVTSGGDAYKYLGVYKAGNPSITSFPNHTYQFQLYKDAVPETEFVIERKSDDIHQFTIESALYRGWYFNSGKWKGHLGTDHVNIVFENGKKYWFFQ